MKTGDRINDQYTLDRRLSTGEAEAASSTWLAKGESDQQVVIKIGPVAGEDGTTLQAQAQSLERLRHPQIPNYVDAFETDVDGVSMFAFVRDHVPGQSVAACMAKGRHFSEKEAMELTMGITDILDYLHQLSPPIVHRHITPDHVILDDNDKPFLIDFDDVGDQARNELVHPDSMADVGTFGYAPPEQYEGQAVPQSDIYSLGVTLVHMLTRTEPWEMAKVGTRLDYSRSVDLSVPFQKVLNRMIEPDAGARYPTITALKAELEPALHGYQPATVKSSSKVVLLTVLAVPVGIGVVLAGLLALLLALIF